MRGPWHLDYDTLGHTNEAHPEPRTSEASSTASCEDSKLCDCPLEIADAGWNETAWLSFRFAN